MRQPLLGSYLDRLEKLEYIEKKLNLFDRRETLLNITEVGEKFAVTYNAIVDEMSLVYYRGFTEEQICEFEEYLQKIYFNFK